MCVVYTCEMQGLPVDSCNVKDTANSMDDSTFGSKVVQISVRNTKVYKMREICRAIIFRILQHFATKLCNFTNFKMLFLAVVMDFVLLA